MYGCGGNRQVVREDVSRETDVAADYPTADADSVTTSKTAKRVHKTVLQILNNLENTGYSHRPFFAQPDFRRLADAPSDQRFNLFLDCSGFVGYYVLQGVAKANFNQLPRGFSCGADARPLAADFVDLARLLPKTSTCWSVVDDLSKVAPGDVIAYLHEENIDPALYCCSDASGKTRRIGSAPECTAPERVIRKTRRYSNGRRMNTGHVLFAIGKPYQNEDDKRRKEWVVPVADSTTSPHMSDSRSKGHRNSRYGKDGNRYTAWDRRKMTCLDAAQPQRQYSCVFGEVERCQGKGGDVSYEYQCRQSEQKLGSVSLDSVTVNSPTGVGAGLIYIRDDMRGFRNSDGGSLKHATVVVLRPLDCDGSQ